MIDINRLRADPYGIAAKLATRNFWFDVEAFVKADKMLREFKTAADSARHEVKSLSKQIGGMKARGEDASSLVASVAEHSEYAAQCDKCIKELSEALDLLIADMPNLPHESVPIGGIKHAKE